VISAKSESGPGAAGIEEWLFSSGSPAVRPFFPEFLYPLCHKELRPAAGGILMLTNPFRLFIMHPMFVKGVNREACRATNGAAGAWPGGC